MERELLGGQPPPERGHAPGVTRIVPVKPGHPVTVVFLAETCWGVNTHWRPAGEWGGARTIGCSMPDRPCRFCHLAPGWSGYYPVVDMATGVPSALCVTPDADRQLRWRRGVRGNRPPLTHSKWRVSKSRADSRAPLFLELLDPACPTYIEWATPDLRPLLRRLFPEIADLFAQAAQLGGDDAP